MTGIDSLDIEHVERDERCDRQHAQVPRERVDNRHIPRWVTASKEEHHAQHECKSTHLLQREEKQSRDFRLGRTQEQAGHEWLAADDQESAPGDHEHRKETQHNPQRTKRWRGRKVTLSDWDGLYVRTNPVEAT